MFDVRYKTHKTTILLTYIILINFAEKDVDNKTANIHHTHFVEKVVVEKEGTA